MTPYISTTFSNYGSSILDVLALLEQENIHKVELGSIHRYEENLTKPLKSFNFEYASHNFFPAHKNEHFVVNIASNVADIRRQSTNYLKDNISFAADIGASLFTFHPGFLSTPEPSSDSTENYDFKFPKKQIDRQEAFKWFLESTEQLLSHAENKNIKIAIETQGSKTQSQQILFSTNEEIALLMETFGSAYLGLNLNLAHFYIANQENFEENFEKIKKHSSRIFAMELSHTDGIIDSHSPLLESGWYWRFIMDDALQKAKKIIELRDQDISTIQDQIKLYSQKLQEKNP